MICQIHHNSIRIQTFKSFDRRANILTQESETTYESAGRSRGHPSVIRHTRKFLQERTKTRMFWAGPESVGRWVLLVTMGFFEKLTHVTNVHITMMDVDTYCRHAGNTWVNTDSFLATAEVWRGRAGIRFVWVWKPCACVTQVSSILHLQTITKLLRIYSAKAI